MVSSTKIEPSCSSCRKNLASFLTSEIVLQPNIAGVFATNAGLNLAKMRETIAQRYVFLHFRQDKPDIPVRKCVILIPDKTIVVFENLLTFLNTG